MSRSYKVPWIKDPTNRRMKPVFARAHRRIIRVITSEYRKGWRQWQNVDMDDDDPDFLFHLDPEYPHPNELLNPWDICDWRYYFNEIKYKRK